MQCADAAASVPEVWGECTDCADTRTTCGGFTPSIEASVPQRRVAAYAYHSNGKGWRDWSAAKIVGAKIFEKKKWPSDSSSIPKASQKQARRLFEEPIACQARPATSG